MQVVLDWARVVVATLARAVVVLALGLAFWAVAPAALGWQPTTTMTGSMEPGIAVGDVVVSRPVPPTELRVGQVLLTDDPDHADRLRFHRFAEAGEGGAIVTKGDANPDLDSSPVAAHQVHGVGVLRVPFVGLPATWAAEGRTAPLVLLALSGVLLLALTTVDRSLRHVDEAGRGGEGAGPRASGHRAPASRRALLDHRRRTRRRHRAGALALVVGATSVGALLPAQAVAAPFHTSTATTGSFAALQLGQPTGLSCRIEGKTALISFSPTGPAADRYRLVHNGRTLDTSSTTETTIRFTPPVSLVELASSHVLEVQAVLGPVGSPDPWRATSATSVTVVSTNVAGLLGSVTCRP